MTPTTPDADRSFWFADVDEEGGHGDFKWVAVLQAPGGCFPLPIWHPSKWACLHWIKTNIVGAGLEED